ncbi:hypothetical protein AAVH_01458 [Aphelenchoides avenae]|nr:hypothetical protein AAVH_01458 [Aphelenchus avenae]
MKLTCEAQLETPPQYAFNEYFAGRDTAKRIRPPDEPNPTKLWELLQLVLNLVRWILYTLYEALSGSGNAGNAAVAKMEKK